MGEPEKKMEKDTKKEEKKEADAIVNEELVRWMTEGTSPNSTPRSDCG
jgi:hypothetical protein